MAQTSNSPSSAVADDYHESENLHGDDNLSRGSFHVVVSFHHSQTHSNCAK